jgi:hypothetical protein
MSAMGILLSDGSIWLGLRLILSVEAATIEFLVAEVVGIRLTQLLDIVVPTLFQTLQHMHVNASWSFAESRDHFHDLFNLNLFFLRIVLLHRMGDTGMEVMLHDNLLHTFQRRDHCRGLGENVDAVPVHFHHLP